MIRKVTIKDKDIFLQMCKAFYQSAAVLCCVSDDVLENNFNEIIRSDQYLEGFIFEKEDQVCGYGIISKTFSSEVGGICIWIEEIYVLEQFRGLELGTTFLKFIEENYVFERIRLEVEKDNNRALSLYLRKGYQKLNYLQMSKEV